MWVASAGKDKHPNAREGPRAACINAPTCRHTRDNHGLRPPTRLQEVHMKQLYSPVQPQSVTAALPCPMMSAPHLKWPQQSIFPHACSSHSSEGMALASLDQDEVLEDDFQTQHTQVCHVRWRGTVAVDPQLGGGLECTGGSPGQWATYCLDISEEETLETVDPTWQTTRWLQLAVQGISDDEVPWYECIAPLTLGAEGTALSLAKCLLTVWGWSLRVQGWDICPPTPTILNIGQFMMWDEVQGKWTICYGLRCTLASCREWGRLYTVSNGSG